MHVTNSSDGGLQSPADSGTGADRGNIDPVVVLVPPLFTERTQSWVSRKLILRTIGTIFAVGLIAAFIFLVKCEVGIPLKGQFIMIITVGCVPRTLLTTCLKLTVILAAELAAALALASIVSRDKKAYSQKLVHGAKTLFKFSRNQLGRLICISDLHKGRGQEYQVWQ
ncbi:hypothetical protein ACET3Z_021807 [Daucus carota]